MNTTCRRTLALRGIATSLLLAGICAGTLTAAADEKSPETPRYLIINADDLGLSDGVTEGIVQAWRDGVVTSTSAMINMDGARERIAAVHETYPDLPIGLHVNITTGRPVLPPDRIPTLVDEHGRFFARDALVLRLPHISLDELRAEVRAQAELLIATGVRPDHIDYHEGMVVLYTPFYQVVRELAREYGVPVRQPVPESVYKRIKFAGRASTGVGVWQMVWFGLRHPILGMKLMPHMTPAAFRKQAALLQAEGIPAPALFIDGFFAHATVENFISMLKQLPPGVSEVAVHPGLVDEGLRQWGGGYVEEREAELKVLLDPRVRAAIAEHGVEPVSFRFFRQDG